VADFKITQKQFEKMVARQDALEAENKELRKLFGGLAPKREEAKEEKPKTEPAPEAEEKPKKKGLFDGIFG
jgi:regulator of replication initiation timing